MARSYDIADLMTSDGEYITDSVRRKINGNFRRILQLMQTELPGQERQALAGAVEVIVTGLIDRMMPDIEDRLFGDMYPVGSVISCSSEDDPRLLRGTWEMVGDGRYVRCASDSVPPMSTGGSGEHLVSWDELPATETEILTAAGDSAGFRLVMPVNTGQQPIPIEPEYVALLFYRRTA